MPELGDDYDDLERDNPDAGKFIRQETEELLSILGKDDLVPLTIRFHLVAESHLDRIIAARLPRGNHLLKGQGPRFTFLHKIRIIESLVRKDSPVFSCLRHLNSLRNDCAHDRYKVVDVEDLTKVGSPMGQEFAQLRRDHSDVIGDFASAVYASIFGKLSAILYHTERHPT